jgi:hypothetical protein
MNRRRSHFSVLGATFVFPPPREALRRDLAGALAKAGRFGLRTAAVLALATFPVELVGRQAAQGAAGNRQTGQSMYAKAGCETCHGANGQGTAAGPRIAGTARDVPGFIAYVRKPTGTMPAFQTRHSATSTRFCGRPRPRRLQPHRRFQRDGHRQAPRCTRRSAAISVTPTRHRGDCRDRESVPIRFRSPASRSTHGLRRETCRRTPRRCCRTRISQTSTRFCSRSRVPRR